MSDNEEIRKISDSSLPNAGRVYDYLLGGDYYFDVDKKVAEELEKKIPFAKSAVRLIRWFLGKAVDIALNSGFTQFIDFASGLPTVDHIHTRIPEKIKQNVIIIYSDIDPVKVQLGRDIIGDTPLIKYVQCDCRKPETLLESDIAKNLIDKKQKIALGLSGICWFLTDEQISNTIKILYKWASKNSILYFNDYNSENLKENEDFKAFLNLYKEINQPIYLRSRKKLLELINPWKVKKPGLLILEEWFNFPPDISDQFNNWIGGATYGGILEK